MATPNLNFYGLSALPPTLEADAFYYIENGTYAEAYITNSGGVARMVGNSTMINALISQELAQWTGSSSQVTIVADIAARNDLAATAETNLMVLVLDASADATVASGSALYAYSLSATTWYKVAEYESMDVTVAWTDISGRPNSSAAQIDDAVSKAHQHTNRAQLDKIGEDNNGDMTYGGNAIKTKWLDKAW